MTLSSPVHSFWLGLRNMELESVGGEKESYTRYMLRGTQNRYSVFFQPDGGSRGTDIVVYAKACMAVQTPGLTNVSAEAEIPASGCNKAALISVRRNVRVRECVFEREAELEGETCDRKKSLRAFGCSTAEDKAV